jgi:hypothetical protein
MEKTTWQLACNEQDACTHAYRGTTYSTQPVKSQVIPVEIQSQCEIDHGVGSGDRVQIRPCLSMAFQLLM